MKTYILIFGIANIVAGGPIYDSNKIKYLKEHGWTVNVLPTDTGKIYIKPLEEYSDAFFPFIGLPPYVFSRKELEKKLDLLVSHVAVSEEMVIETGTDYTALWGELLAKRLKAKHIVMFLDEKNPHVNRYTASFYKFKYERNELASISLKSLHYIFGEYFELSNDQKHVLGAACSNVVSDIDSDLRDKIPQGDYVIGSIGRLDKLFVPEIIDGICEFANIVPDKIISVCLLGGADDSFIHQVECKLAEQKNIRYYISGYIWPIPQNIFEKVDVFISAAGSSRVSVNQNVPTIRLDVITYKPEGYYNDLINNQLIQLSKKDASISDYLVEFLLNKREIPIYGTVSLQEEWSWICEKFDQHMEFMKNSCLQKEYYPTDKLWNGSIKTVMKKIYVSMLGLDKYYFLKDKL